MNESNMTPNVAPNPITADHKPICDVIVIGGGFAGSFTALELLKRGYKVLHIDKDYRILGEGSSSYNECYKLHTGVHYLGDLETARQCLLGSIEFARDFPQFIQGDSNDPWRKGRHYVVSNTLYEPEAVCQTLKELYAQKVEEDERNAVFGEPENFIKYLNHDEYPYVASQIEYRNEGYQLDVMYDIIPSDQYIKPNKIYLYLETGQIKFKAIKNGQIQTVQIEDDGSDEFQSIKEDLSSGGKNELCPAKKEYIYKRTSSYDPLFNPQGLVEKIHVKTAIETPESQIDIDKLRKYLEDEFAKYPNYTFLPGNRVMNISYAQGTLDYVIETTDASKEEHSSYTTHGVVNCTWHNIETLDGKLGLATQDGTVITLPDGKTKTVKDDRVIRIKISLLVTLPDSLKNVNTCIFSCGPHMSFTNLGNGTAVITYEPITNAGSYLAATVILPEELQELYAEKLVPNSGKGREFAERILEGASHYLPDLKAPSCQVKEVRLGHVKIFVPDGQSYSLSDKESAIHGRQEDGVEQKGLCYVSHSGMKMTYTTQGAKRVADILDGHFYTRDVLLARKEDKLAPTKPIASLIRKKISPLKVTLFYDTILLNIFRNVTVESARVICRKKIDRDLGSISQHTLDKEVKDIETFTKNEIMKGIENKFNLLDEIKYATQSLGNDSEQCLRPSEVNKLLSRPT